MHTGFKGGMLALALVATPGPALLGANSAQAAAPPAPSAQPLQAAPPAKPVAATQLSAGAKAQASTQATQSGLANTPTTEAIANQVSAGNATAKPSATTGAGSYTPMTPTPGIGMPVPGAIGLQKQFSPTGEYASAIHQGLLWIIALITLFVLVLLVLAVVRFHHRRHPVASRTSHNFGLEVAWTLVPVLILVGIAVPSFDLIAKQYKPAPKSALTVKVTGNQWFWSYSYPDNGDFEVVSNMLNIPGIPTINNGVRMVGSRPWDGPAHLEVDNRMVLPVGEPIRLQITAADVIHSFAVPSLWFKLDAVPGRINEKVLFIEKPGVYYGQCSELCGAKHGFMPIAVEALPRDKYNAWVLTHAGGKIDTHTSDDAAAATAPAAPASAAPSGAASESASGDATAEAQ